VGSGHKKKEGGRSKQSNAMKGELIAASPGRLPVSRRRKEGNKPKIPSLSHKTQQGGRVKS